VGLVVGWVVGGGLVVGWVVGGSVVVGWVVEVVRPGPFAVVGGPSLGIAVGVVTGPGGLVLAGALVPSAGELVPGAGGSM